MFANLITMAQAGSDEAMMKLMERFERLLKKYARLLRYEDALSDLTLEFIRLIRAIRLERLASNNDGALVNYIVQAVKHSYYKLVKQAVEVSYQETCFTDLSEEQLHKVDAQNATDDTDEWFEFLSHFPAGVLTERAQSILTKEFYFGMSSAEIAEQEGVSRQSVNQIKQRALKKLGTIVEREGRHGKERE